MQHQLGKIFVISAPSGAGKSSLVRALCTLNPEIQVSISHTTRQKRPNEVEGVDYYFISQTEFATMLQHKQFLEHALVYGNHYGTNIKTIENLLKQGKNIILEIDWQGALQVKKIFAQAVLIYITPPSKAELELRLRRRNTDSEDVIRKRLAAFDEDMSHAAEFDFNVINNDFDAALHDIYSIMLNSTT